MNTSKSCNLKGQQKIFLFDQNKAYSCCRGYPFDLDQSMSYQTVTSFWQQEKQQLDQGIPVPSCEVCWKREKNGELSHRLQTGTDDSDVIELSFSNACNHMCSYCSPKFSSTWQDSINTHGMFDNISRMAKDNLQVLKAPVLDAEQWIEQIKDYINGRPDDSVTLRLLGGEPLMQISNLQNLFQIQNKKIKTIKITTNLSPPDNKFLLWLLNNVDVEKFEINISLDASPEYNHIPRAGFDQEKFQTNLQLLIDHKVKFEFMAVVSVLGIFDIANYTRWYRQNNFKVSFLTINQPDCLDPKLIPHKFLQPLLAEFDDQTMPLIFSNLLRIEQPEVGLKLFEQYNYLTQYFSRTSIDPKKINNQHFQGYWNWLTNKVKK